MIEQERVRLHCRCWINRTALSVADCFCRLHPRPQGATHGSGCAAASIWGTGKAMPAGATAVLDRLGAGVPYAAQRTTHRFRRIPAQLIRVRVRGSSNAQ